MYMDVMNASQKPSWSFCCWFCVWTTGHIANRTNEWHKRNVLWIWFQISIIQTWNIINKTGNQRVEGTHNKNTNVNKSDREHVHSYTNCRHTPRIYTYLYKCTSIQIHPRTQANTYTKKNASSYFHLLLLWFTYYYDSQHRQQSL